MKPVIARATLPVRVADLIEAGLRSGQWQHGLPGYRKLAAEFEVSWRTAGAALKLVEARGLLKPAAPGQSRTPAAAPRGKTAPRSGNLLILWSAPHSADLLMRDEIHALAAFWEKHRGRVHMVTVDYARHRRPAPFMAAQREKCRAAAVLLALPPAAWIQSAVEMKLPVYCIGGEQNGLQGFSGHGYPAGIEIEAAVRRLRGLGHRRLLIPSSPASERLLSTIRAAFASGCGGNVSAEEVARACPVFQESVPEVWQTYWASAFAGQHPTAVICVHEKWVFSLYGYCAAQRLRIPDDVSVLSMTSSETLSWCHPRPVCMKYPTHRSLALFKAWVRRGCESHGIKHLRLCELEGASLAQAPR